VKYLEGEERKEAEAYLLMAASYAETATCSRAKCGAVIISPKVRLIGGGFNSPAGNKESRRRCVRRKSEYDEKVTDKTCCVHAEQRAIMDALRSNPDHIEGATMYFARLDSDTGLSDHHRPYCTICSKMMVDVGLKWFVRYQDGDIIRYDTEEYDLISADYRP
jgi:deoxycytidylate deaminase